MYRRLLKHFMSNPIFRGRKGAWARGRKAMTTNNSISARKKETNRLFLLFSISRSVFRGGEGRGKKKLFAAAEIAARKRKKQKETAAQFLEDIGWKRRRRKRGGQKSKASSSYFFIPALC